MFFPGKWSFVGFIIGFLISWLIGEPVDFHEGVASNAPPYSGAILIGFLIGWYFDSREKRSKER